MPSHDPLTHFVVEFRALKDPDGVAPAIRVRQLLKIALRRFYLRAGTIQPPPKDAGQAGAEKGPHP